MHLDQLKVMEIVLHAFRVILFVRSLARALFIANWLIKLSSWCKTNYLTAQWHCFPVNEAPSPAKWKSNIPLVYDYILVVNKVYWFPSGWAQRRLPSMDTDDFETIPSSAEESSNSSEEEGNNKNVGNAHFGQKM